ncbi:L-2-amino-thiazoline-4-carboxylic acid hydrolase [Stackebrandtia nassauensis]|uniref:L-2-amino-thiazoline-4-carboxylic acid hydrolase n=1 Tax=Stackebrandtia nassauensis (strain DSM 44728 / CIP 108903 / NRRL B-16338 / NBRC 102104 / LLR-40K-21) TaxID=446470 RepID=D3Q5Y3_STANL|nr:L-2-amino-thiazoline-4-carboxylic acid hydrolase [Stackebrandtia nassauensis]ADD40282.1 hypothetical protein Snas_0568 [Stackebrandtia nassauensis DSM 44728]
MPSQQSRELVELFYRRLTDDLGDRSGLVDRIRELQARLVAETGELPDPPAHDNVLYTAAVLAAYRVLRQHEAAHPDGRGLIAWLTAAFTEPLAEQVREGTEAMLDGSPDPFAVMTELAKRVEGEQYGAQFAFEHSQDDERGFHTDVHRCGYHDFFVKHDAAELTPVLCAFDANWYEAIDPERHGFRFTRSTTIGLGGRICPFHFDRQD